MTKYKWMSYNTIEKIEVNKKYIIKSKYFGIPVFDTFEEAKQDIINIIDNNITKIKHDLLVEYKKLKIAKQLSEVK